MTRPLLLFLALTACGPTADHRGEAGQHCKPDGSCVGALLECVHNPIYWDDEPTCRVKEKR